MARDEVLADTGVLGPDLRLAKRGNVMDKPLGATTRRILRLPSEMERPQHDPRRVRMQPLIQNDQRTIRNGSFDAHRFLHSNRAAGRARALAWNNGRVERRESILLHSFRSHLAE